MSNEVKKRILEESMQLMFTHGIKVMTMDELAKRIGVSKRTIYEHFEDKDALLAAILREKKKENKKQSEKILKESPTVIHVFFYYLKNQIQNDFFAKLVSRTDEIKRYHPAVYQKEIIEYQKNDLKKSKEVFQLGIKQGVFRKDLNLDIVVSMFHSLSQQLFENENGLRQNFPLDKLFETYIQIFIRGCCTDKGIQVIEKIENQKSKIKNK
jgi:AcrR family transcriptional regulator